jgi:hypothetical protein
MKIMMKSLTLSFWQRRIQDYHETNLSCISFVQAAEPQDCYRLLEDMPHQHYFYVHPKVQ